MPSGEDSIVIVEFMGNDQMTITGATGFEFTFQVDDGYTSEENELNNLTVLSLGTGSQSDFNIISSQANSSLLITGPGSSTFDDNDITVFNGTDLTVGASVSGSGNTVYLHPTATINGSLPSGVSVVAVPEPSSFALIVLGLGGFILLRQRR